MFIAGWQKLVQRYKDAPNILGADLKNEPFDATVNVRRRAVLLRGLVTLALSFDSQWLTGNRLTDWQPVAERVGNIILSYGVGWLIFVEGCTPCDTCFFSEGEAMCSWRRVLLIFLFPCLARQI